MVDLANVKDRLPLHGYTLLREQYPNSDLALLDLQEPATPTWAAGPWWCVDLLVEGKLKQFAIWKYTGNVYRVGADGAVEDDPFLTVTPLGDT